MPNLYLVGFMGAGKTEVGRALAERLGYRFVDLDAMVEERLGVSVQQVFADLGEAAFRRAETAALRSTVALDRVVVATGGGAFCSAENRDIVRRGQGVSVYLDLPWEVLEARLPGPSPERPKLGRPEENRRLFEERRPHYAAATIIVRLSGEETPAAMAEMVDRALVETTCAT